MAVLTGSFFSALLRHNAERFLKNFQERLAKFGLEIQPEKTRLMVNSR
jgi:hypothetical protein